ncbi:RluA family pseudouridine synthase [Paenisporosarcina quisquiliarum]|uniref:Pseudouridine synthase n=1 Tax=Paenisporosarcina quisquiliarum TaxID=365346 RepID=A0A9X3LEJ3_9BACL|nr:RluA family pseudouridine synthase [Paenisporosarcina quisquiliarum]MCZ8536555.1 RluA family pseudouridine synthase [Paenisporosarcina quisquiliarum]
MYKQFHLVFNVTEPMLLREALALWGISKRTLTSIKFDGGCLLVNGQEKTVRHSLSVGDVVTVLFPYEEVSEGLIRQEGPLDIVYEDDVLLIVNKPPGQSTIPSREHPSHTLANYVAHYYEKMSIPSTVHILTRLDKDTSGLVCLVKNRHIHHIMNHGHVMNKTYEAIAHGKVEKPFQQIIEPIGRKGDSIIEREVREDGLFAHTDISIIRQSFHFSHVRCLLHTGRTHQIRVHLAHIGHPIMGDDLYGGKLDLIKRQALHCASVEIKHPLTGEMLTIISPLPEDMKKLLI